MSLASMVKDIKVASAAYIKNNNLFPMFSGWQDGYGGFTYSFNDKDKLIEYVKNHNIIKRNHSERNLLNY
jgi:hypothetical protein